MKNRFSLFFLSTLLLTLLFPSVYAQKKSLKVGIPTLESAENAKSLFASPLKGYGEVSFFWWMGDTLTREHLSWELDMLSKMKISGLQVNYAHDDKGGQTYGLTLPSKPKLFSDEWWNLFRWFEGEADKRGMFVSLSDYTLGVAGQGSYIDSALIDNPKLSGGELRFESIIATGKVNKEMKYPVLCAIAYQGNKSIDVTGSITDNRLEWECPNGEWTIGVVYRFDKKVSYDPMNPESGKYYLKHFFQKFEDKFPPEDKGGLNFFFSDELQFNLTGYLWNDVFQQEFIKRKGYDIVPLLPGLFMNIGDISAKVRLDFNDIMVSLSEENYFKPIYDWHNSRGLVYGCDHGGRGRDVVEFGDYYRTQRWNIAPGCDQPYLQKDIIKNKVASSIAHMYERPRVWLEGFHSSGWGTNTEQIMDAIYANFAMGHNLLSLHGLYYSTPGGWWEWAPPCNHFRMPYWEQMGSMLECTERMSFLFSQGKHCADVAILYPVEPVIAGYGLDAVNCAFNVGETLYKQSIDFDFMDYESLTRAEIKNSELKVAGESFKVLIVPSMRAIKQASLEKILAFKRSGGIVLMMGNLPEATEKAGAGQKETKDLVAQIVSSNSKSKVFQLETAKQAVEIIDKLLVRDFRVVSTIEPDDQPYILHRTLDNKQMYAVYGVPAGSECFFRTKGAVELWDPWTGKTKLLEVEKITEQGTFLHMPLEKTEIQILMFNPKEKAVLANGYTEKKQDVVQILDDEWEFEVRPVLDNRYGDFRWPATKELIGAYVYWARYSQGTTSDEQWKNPSFDDKLWKMQNFSYGSKFLILNAVPELTDEQLMNNLPAEPAGYQSSSFDINGFRYNWSPYEYSWRWGVKDDPGRQGWHGLKAKVHDDFIKLGNFQSIWSGYSRSAASNGYNDYYLYTQVNAETDGEYEANIGDMLPKSVYINGAKQDGSKNILHLKRGANTLVLHYTSYGATHYVLRKQGAVPQITSESQAERPLAMSFRGDQSLLMYDIGQSVGQSNHFRFKSAPGLERLIFRSYGEARVWVNGTSCKMELTKKGTDGLMWYEAIVTHPDKRPATVAIEIAHTWGYRGGSSIDDGVLQLCGKGLSMLGDWSKADGLAAYSGSAIYRKTVSIPSHSGDKLILDLGRVVSTAELNVNGKNAGLRMSPPWQFDITDLVHDGENQLEILVHNTVANHYLSIPTIFRGSVEAGITGPVTIISEK
ncbi:glycosyl hydrolase [Dysgonomonas reticulitermitis]